MDYLFTLGQLLAAYAGLWLVNALMATRNNIFQEGFAFDTKYFLQGVAKALILVVAMGTGGFILIQVPALLTSLGVTLADGMAEAISLVGVAASVAGGLFTQARKFRENVNRTFNTEDTKFTLSLDKDNFNNGFATFDVTQTENVSEDYVEQKKAAELIGGIGAQYSVNISSYSAFRKAVLSKGFDIDGFYGWQCWDGAALLWQQLGKNLWTGNGLAIGCWDLKRHDNTYGLFDLVTSVGSLKVGDVVCMRPNHIGFFDGWDGAYMKILGQNQGGAANRNGGSAFNVVRVHKTAFAGAFRLKKWHKKAPAKSVATIAKEVLAGKWGNGDDRKKALVKAGYNYAQVQAEVNKLVAKKPAKKSAPKTKAVYVTVKKGWGLSNVALAAGFKDYGKSTRWAAIAKLNKSSNWKTFNSKLFVGQKVRVK